MAPAVAQWTSRELSAREAFNVDEAAASAEWDLDEAAASLVYDDAIQTAENTWNTAEQSAWNTYAGIEADADATWQNKATLAASTYESAIQNAETAWRETESDAWETFQDALSVAFAANESAITAETASDQNTEDGYESADSVANIQVPQSGTATNNASSGASLDDYTGYVPWYTDYFNRVFSWSPTQPAVSTLDRFLEGTRKTAIVTAGASGGAAAGLSAAGVAGVSQIGTVGLGSVGTQAAIEFHFLTGGAVTLTAKVAPNLPAGRYAALVIDGKIYVARMHIVAWEMAGKKGVELFYGRADIDAAGKVIRLIK